jgi:hypothetical protein
VLLNALHVPPQAWQLGEPNNPYMHVSMSQ